MGILEDLTEKLARDVVQAMDDTGDDTLVDQISKVLISTSSTTQESFMTAVKIIIAERRARDYLTAKVARAKAAKAGAAKAAE